MHILVAESINPLRLGDPGCLNPMRKVLKRRVPIDARSEICLRVKTSKQTIFFPVLTSTNPRTSFTSFHPQGLLISTFLF